MIIMNLIEPIFWQQISIYLHNLMLNNKILYLIFPILSDLFVFFYPFLLIIIYLIGFKQNNIKYKKLSLVLFFSAFVTTLINITLQSFFHKQRPIFYFHTVQQANTLLHKILPSSSFPSDHAWISFAIASAMLFWALKNKDKKIKRLSYLFFVFAIIMSISRIFTQVHWPTDIIAWIIVWFVWSIIVIKFSSFFDRIYVFLINLWDNLLYFFRINKILWIKKSW